MTLGKFMADRGISQSELARAIGLLPSAVNHRLAGRRRWMLDEANAALAFLRERCNEPDLTLDRLFGDRRQKRGRKVAA